MTNNGISGSLGTTFQSVLRRWGCSYKRAFTSTLFNYFVDNIIFAQTCQGSLISSSTPPQLFPFCPPPSTFNYKDDKVLKISHGPDVFHGLGKKKSEVPIIQKMKRQHYQMIIMIIFFQKQTDPPTCRS